MTTKMSVSEFKKQCTRVLRELHLQRDELEITNHSKSIAVIKPIIKQKEHPAWGYLGNSVMEISNDFDIPLGDNDWESAQ